MIKSLILTCFFSLSLSLVLAQMPQEYIISYDIDIVVETDRSIEVTEFIRVKSNQQDIKRGITRDFVNSRILGDHGQQHLDYDIIYVRKDNIDEPYHVDTKGGNDRLYIGSKDVILQAGIYDYTIQYKVKDQIAFFDNYDEFYWNAIGLTNNFIVESASIDIVFPEGSKVSQASGYTGLVGAKNQDFKQEINDHVINYTITKPLLAKEGITLAIGIEKGIIDSPSFVQKYSIAVLLGALSIFLLIYFPVSWFLYGRDPKSPEVEGQFDSPNGLSPAISSYIYFEGTKTIGITASIVDLVNKDYIQIKPIENSRSRNGTNFTLTELGKNWSDLPDEQRALLRGLFPTNHGNQILISGKYNPDVLTAYQAHQKSIKDQFKRFINEGNNAKRTVLPTLMIIIGLVMSIILYSLYVYNDIVPWYYLVIFGIIAFISLIVYSFLIKKPTTEKLDLQARIQAFKDYIEMSEEGRDEILDAPQRTIEHYERLLPFAISLKAEKAWNSHFSNLLEESSYYKNENRYYLSPHMHFNRSFGQTFVQSTSQPASTSSGGSGSSGGGFSGGGGGGGGVGGW